MVSPYRRECGGAPVTSRYVHQGLTEKYGLTVACRSCGEQAALPRPGLEPEVAHRATCPLWSGPTVGLSQPRWAGAGHLAALRARMNRTDN